MKTASLILNALLMWALGFGSAVCQIKLRNVLMYPKFYAKFYPYPDLLPLVSAHAVNVFWLWWGIPLVWTGVTLAAVFAGWRNPDKMAGLVQLHTSATLLIGIAMLVFFAIAGILPFVGIVL